MKGVIFDLDGVICFTDEYHYLAWKAMADEIGAEFDRTKNNRLRGVSRMESLEIILEGYHGEPMTQERKEELAEYKNNLYREYLKEMTPADLPEDVKETLDKLRKAGYKMAIGSSSKNTKTILERIGLENFFDAVADGTMITKSKPDPEVFLLAAKLLELPAEECMVVEDAVSGAQAGHAGGFKVACLGDASKEGAGDYNMKGISELVDILGKAE